MSTIQCSATFPTMASPMPTVIAHRGAPRHAPENTLASFLAAKQLGAKWVETDVLMSRDNIAVVFHDNWLDRTTNAKGRLRDVDSAELYGLDAGSHFSEKCKGERVPSLRATLEFCRQAGLGLNLEIKHCNDDETVIANEEEILFEEMLAHATCDIVDQIWTEDSNLMFSSYSHHCLKVCQERMPHIKRGLLVNNIPMNWHELVASLDVCCINFWVEDVRNTDKVVREVSRSVPLYAYCVNDAETATKLLALGCQGIFTDALDAVGEAVMAHNGGQELHTPLDVTQ